MSKQTFRLFGLAALMVAATNAARADVQLFADNFENGTLAQWTGKIGEPHQGVIVSDPLNPANKVLTFTGVNAVGDIFTAEKLDVSGPRRYVLSFDFLGLPTGEVPPAEYGGFVGITAEPTWDAEHYWLAGTAPDALNVPAPVATELVADGVWRRYTIDLTDVIEASGWEELHLMLEDWLERESIPGDVFFDNIKLVAVLDADAFGELVPCSGPLSGGKWRNHGQYVAAMTQAVHAALKADLITRSEAAAIITTAARSDCGKPTYQGNCGSRFQKAARLLQALKKHQSRGAGCR